MVYWQLLHHLQRLNSKTETQNFQHLVRRAIYNVLLFSGLINGYSAIIHTTTKRSRKKGAKEMKKKRAKHEYQLYLMKQQKLNQTAYCT